MSDETPKPKRRPPGGRMMTLDGRMRFLAKTISSKSKDVKLSDKLAACKMLTEMLGDRIKEENGSAPVTTLRFVDAPPKAPQAPPAEEPKPAAEAPEPAPEEPKPDVGGKEPVKGAPTETLAFQVDTSLVKQKVDLT